MGTLNSTLQALEQAIAAEPIGTPVAMRLIAQTLSDARDIPLLLARLTATATKWLGGNIETLYAQGSEQNGQVTCLARLDRGQSLIVSAGTRGTTMPLTEAIVWGNRGMLAAGGQFAYMLAGDDDTDFKLTEEERRVAQLVRLAQQARQAISASAPGSTSSSKVRGEHSASTFDMHARKKRRPLEPPFGILLVAGDHTHQPMYAEAFAADPRCRLVAVADEEGVSPRRHELNDRMAKHLGIRLLPNLNEAMQRPDVHAVSICAEPERRAGIIIRAAQAKRHVYLDKPLCAAVEQAVGIVTAVRQNNVLGHMFSQVGCEPATRVREIVHSGQLGEIQAIHCDLCFAKGHFAGRPLVKSRVESERPDRFELPDSKRELTNIGVYCVVMLLWLLRRNVRRVFAATENYFFTEHESNDMEDFGQMLLELDGGVTASVTATRCGWRSHPTSGLNRVCLVGSRGNAAVDAHRPRVDVWSERPAWSPPERDPDDPMAMWPTRKDSTYLAKSKSDWILPSSSIVSIDVAQFLDALQQGRDSDVTVEIAGAATELLTAAYRSSALRQVVELPLGQS